MTTHDPKSPRLTYRRLTPEDVDDYHALLTDPHVRRYLMDGEVVNRDWAATSQAKSTRSFERDDYGIWLLSHPDEHNSDPFGFCGYYDSDEPTPGPQLLYAFREEHTGQGLATEVTMALLALASGWGWDRVAAAVDSPNTASLRVLRKCGFLQTQVFPGAFGDNLFLERHFERPLPLDVVLDSLLKGAPTEGEGEIVESFLSRPGVRLERIVSRGESTPEGVWYEQDQNEWVALLAGSARIGFADGTERRLTVGDSLLLPARSRHRVEWTDPKSATIWIAVFFS
jgi:cupin 2 domain-containing protein